MKIPKIQNIYATDLYKLVVTFTNGKRKKYDITPLLDNDVFAPLKNFNFFKNVQVDKGGYAAVWNANIDISEYELWKNGEEIS